MYAQEALAEDVRLGKQENVQENVQEKEYTYNGQQVVTDVNVQKGSGVRAWLRSPRNSSTYVTIVNNGGVSNAVVYSTMYNLRPALWVTGL